MKSPEQTLPADGAALADAYLRRVIDTLQRLDRNAIAAVARLLLDTRKRSGTLFLFGNGGSAATASHMYCDLAKGVSHPLDNRFRVVCLNDNVPAMMAYANDLSWEHIFVEPLKNLIRPGDVAIGISGSGNSLNVVRAIEHANAVGAATVAICGYDGGIISRIATHVIHAHVQDMEISEDVHLIINHALKNLLIAALREEGKSSC